MNNNGTHTSLLLLQVTLNAVFLVYISIKFDMSPEQILMKVEEKIVRAEIQLGSIETKITANKLWIEEATKSLISIDTELQTRGDWMKKVEAKLKEEDENHIDKKEVEALFQGLYINNPGLIK